MQRILIVAAVATATALLAGCSEDKTTGYACLGADNDSLVENIQEHCKAGDAIATKHPAYFCDFNYAVTYNGFNSALCIYTGQQATERVQAENQELISPQLKSEACNGRSYLSVLIGANGTQRNSRLQNASPRIGSACWLNTTVIHTVPAVVLEGVTESWQSSLGRAPTTWRDSL